MQKIDFTLPEIASYMDKISIFFPYGFEGANAIVIDAFILDKIPEDEILNMTSTLENIEDAIEEYRLPGIKGSHKNKASIRRMIELAKDRNDLLEIFVNVEKDLTHESYELKLFLRKAAEIL